MADTMNYNEVERFISRFRVGYNDDVEYVFTNGCCYWFAKILYDRFYDSKRKVRIMYDHVANHFGTKIGEDIYDITGCVTKRYIWASWDDMKDDLLKIRLTEQCINF